MPSIDFTIQLVPMQANRPRFSKNGGIYKDSKHTAYEAMVQRTAAKAMVDAGLTMAADDVPVFVQCLFVFPIPQSWPKYKKQGYYGKSHLQKPDKDNLNKMILDSMSGVVYPDDGQVASGHQAKRWAHLGESPRTEVTVMWGQEGQLW